MRRREEERVVEPERWDVEDDREGRGGEGGTVWSRIPATGKWENG